MAFSPTTINIGCGNEFEGAVIAFPPPHHSLRQVPCSQGSLLAPVPSFNCLLSLYFAPELEKYITTMRVNTPSERLAKIMKCFMRSAACWAVFGNLISKVVMVMGLPWIGPLQVWDGFAWEKDSVLAQATFRTLNVLGCLGFNSLFYASVVLHGPKPYTFCIGSNNLLLIFIEALINTGCFVFHAN